MKQRKDVMKKSPALYITMLVLWTALTVLLWVNFLPKIVNVPFRTGRAVSLGMQIGARILLAFSEAVWKAFFPKPKRQMILFWCATVL